MKPNGMRAWRKTARRWRRKQNRHWRETGAPCVADGTGRWYRRQQAFFKQRPAAPSCPFTPRSLVGMTMGARKRGARWELAANTPSSQERKLAMAGTLRAWYRMGERLRLCPGCLECQPKDCDGCGFSLGAGDDCEVCDAHAVDRYVMGCDGSGVIPARPRVNASKALAVEPARLNP